MNYLGNISKYVIQKEIYKEPFMKKYYFEKEIDTLCIKGAMGIGKTKQLKKLIPKYKKVVILSFRKTLEAEYVKNFEDFELYYNIEENIIDTYINNKVVIQIDSFHRIMGDIDLLILDEFIYTSMHLIESAKYRESCYNTLIEYISNKKTKIVVMDALLDTNTVKWFYHLDRKIKYICNTYEKHNDKIIYNYENKIGVFNNEIKKCLHNKEKIILSTNNKNYLNDLETKIKINFPNIKYKFLNADNSNDIDLDNWNNYDIVGYTPTIVAGVSYENLHFDKVFGYFTSSSSPAELSLQQLFRVRNISTNEIHICVENKNNRSYPKNMDELDKYIIEKNTCLVNGVMGLKLSHINKRIDKDSYYYLYLDVQMKLFNSKNDYLRRLLKLLNLQGINNINNVTDKNDELDKQTRKDLLNTSKEINIKQINDIISSQEITDEIYNLYKNKHNLEYSEKNSMKKKKFRNIYRYEKEISEEQYKKYCKLYTAYKNISICHTFKDNDRLIKYMETCIEDIEKEKINKLEKLGELDTKGRRMVTANTTILHKSKKWEKFIMGLEILNILGLDNISDNKEITINKDDIFNYINKREKIFRILFNLKEINLEEIKNDKNCLQILIKYINSRLKYLFNLTLKISNKKENKYKLTGLEVWNEDFNPMKEDEEILMDYAIKGIIDEIFSEYN